MHGNAEVHKALCRMLEADEASHRCVAAEALGELGDVASIPNLIERLQDHDEDVRSDAAAALSRFGDARACQALRDSLVGDPCGEVKHRAIDALGRLRDQSAVPLFRRLVRDRDSSMCWDDDAIVEGGWDDWLDLQVRAIEALATIGCTDAADDIAAAVTDELGQDLAEVGCRALARLGGRGVDVLSEYLKGADARLRRHAIFALAEGTDGRGRAVLRDATNDSDPDVRCACARAMGAEDTDDPRVVDLLSDPDPRVRSTAIEAFGNRHADKLILRLDDDEAEVVAAALRTLTQLSPPVTLDVIDRIDQLLEDGRPEVLRAAADTLAVIDPDRAAARLVGCFFSLEASDARCAVIRAMGATRSPQVMPALLTAAYDTTRAVRIEAIAALVGLATAETDSIAARQSLCAMLTTEYEPLPDDRPDPPDSDGSQNTDRVETVPSQTPTSTLQAMVDAARAPRPSPAEPEYELTAADREYVGLAKRSPRKAVVGLEPDKAIEDDLRCLIARAVADLPNCDIIDALTKALGAGDTDLEHAAAVSLSHLAGDGVTLPSDTIAALIAAANKSDGQTHVAVVRALGYAEGPDAENVVGAALADEDALVRAEAARASARVGGPQSKLTALLDDPDPGVRLAAAQACASRGMPQAVDLVFDFALAHGAMHWSQAAELLRSMDRNRAAKRCLQVLDDTAAEPFWDSAVRILAMLGRQTRNG